MIIKLSLKSHFKFLKKLKRDKNTQEKKIFVKDIYIFLMTLNNFLNEEFFETSLVFSKKQFFKTNLLKSPMRYKKFFNQVFSEVFFLKICFVYKTVNYMDYTAVVKTFFLLNSKLDVLGTNLLTKTKTTICFLNVYGIIDDFVEDLHPLITKNDYNSLTICY